VNRLLLGNTDIRGCSWSVLAEQPDGTLEAGRLITTLADSGRIKTIVGATFPFDRLPDALERLQSRRSSGKVVLEVRSTAPGVVTRLPEPLRHTGTGP
jgi:NADPH:quinone reductase